MASRSFFPGKNRSAWAFCPCRYCWTHLQFLLNQLNGKSPAREREKLREQMLDTLERWGVRDLRMLGLLPEHALASRLGEDGVKLRRLALGEGMRTLVLCEPSQQFEEAMELECAVETIESLVIYFEPASRAIVRPA